MHYVHNEKLTGSGS